MASLDSLLELDAELERRKEQVVFEADQVLRLQESRLDAVLGRSGAALVGENRQQRANVPQRREEGAEEAANKPTRKGAAAPRVSTASPKTGGPSNNEQDEGAENKKKARPVTSPAGPLSSPTELGPDAVIRMQRAKLKSLADENAQLVEKARSLAEQNAQLKKKASATVEENGRLEKRSTGLEAIKEKLRVEVQSLKDRLSDVEAQLASANKELRDVGKVAREAETEGTTKDMRLHRALDEVEKLKQKVRKAEEESKSSSADVESEVMRLRSENKRLEKQKQELLAAFRKQLKLIDVLKRQKIHLEAAKMLAFTEDEFTRTLQTNS